MKFLDKALNNLQTNLALSSLKRDFEKTAATTSTIPSIFSEETISAKQWGEYGSTIASAKKDIGSKQKSSGIAKLEGLVKTLTERKNVAQDTDNFYGDVATNEIVLAAQPVEGYIEKLNKTITRLKR
jgi:hypothetical protein